jgi:hypothetical protein
MFPITVYDLLLYMATVLFVLGTLAIIVGLIILITKVGGNEIKTIAQQTTQLAQKGIAEDVAGLVGNASSLLDALNQLVRTASGVGIMLILIGFLLDAAAYYLVINAR